MQELHRAISKVMLAQKRNRKVRRYIHIGLLLKVGIVVLIVLILPEVILGVLVDLDFLHTVRAIFLLPGMLLGALFFPSEVFGKGQGTEYWHLIELGFSWIFYTLIIYIVAFKDKSTQGTKRI